MPDTMDIALHIRIRGIDFCHNWNQVVFERYSMFHGIVDGHDQSGLPTPILKLSRNPEVFKLVVDHLSDMAVFPITSSVAESAGLPLDVLVRYLIEDAVFYRLPRLEALARAEQRRLQEKVPASSSTDSDYIKLEKMRLDQRLEMEIRRQDYKLGLKRLEESSFVQFLHYQMQKSKEATAQRQAQTPIQLGNAKIRLCSLLERWRKKREAKLPALQTRVDPGLSAQSV